MKRGGAALLAAMFLLAVAGCGVYSASSGRVDDSIKRVAVPYLENQTSEPNLGVELAEDIIAALQTDNTLKVVEEGDADGIISGRVVRYNRREAFAREDLTVNEYQIQLAVVLTWSVRATGEDLFTNKSFTGTGNYVLDDPDPAAGVGSSEEEARQEAVSEVVRDILAQVTVGW